MSDASRNSEQEHRANQLQIDAKRLNEQSKKIRWSVVNVRLTLFFETKGDGTKGKNRHYLLTEITSIRRTFWKTIHLVATDIHDGAIDTSHKFVARMTWEEEEK